MEKYHENQVINKSYSPTFIIDWNNFYWWREKVINWISGFSPYNSEYQFITSHDLLYGERRDFSNVESTVQR